MSEEEKKEVVSREEDEKKEEESRPLSAALLSGLKSFDKQSALKPTETVVRHVAYIAASKPGGAGPDSAISDEETREYFDSPSELQAKVKEFVSYLRESKHTVFHTGAGISTAAKLPDYRGPTGVWTLRSKGYEPSFKLDIEQALPTYSHMAIVELMKRDLIHFLVSTNVDGLHRRSGVAPESMAELHGNCYKEYCVRCGAEYLRPFDVTKLRKKRFTGRLCEKVDCRARLRDSIINFGEDLPESELVKAETHSKKASLSCVLGSSMRVSPACNLPAMSYQRSDPAMPGKGRLVIVNLQRTHFDPFCEEYTPTARPKGIRVFARIDEFMRMVMDELCIEVPSFGEDTFIQQCEADAKRIVKDPEFWKLPS